MYALYALLRAAAEAVVRVQASSSIRISQRLQRLARGMNERLDNLDEQRKVDDLTSGLTTSSGLRFSRRRRRANGIEIRRAKSKDGSSRESDRFQWHYFHRLRPLQRIPR